MYRWHDLLWRGHGVFDDGLPEKVVLGTHVVVGVPGVHIGGWLTSMSS